MSKWWAQGTLAADSYIKQDLNQVRNGGFETYSSGAFASWSNEFVGAGTVTQEAAIILSGTYSAKLTVAAGGGSVTAIRQPLFSVRAGARWRGTIGLNPGVGGALKLEIYDARSGLYLDPSGAWVKAQAYHKVQAPTGGYTIHPLAFRVPSRRICGANITTIRLRVVADVPSTVNYIDELRAWPETNLVLLAGHNVYAGMPVRLRSSTDGFVANNVLVATMPPRPVTQYAYLPSAITARHILLEFGGTPAEAIRACELIIGYADTPAESPVYGFEISRSLRQIRSGDQSLILSSAIEDGGVLQYEPHSSELEDFEDFVARAIDGSLTVVIPSTERDEVLVGRIPETWAYRVVSYGMTSTEIPFEPLTFPLWTP